MAARDEVPVLDRIRGIERRPPTGDAEAFVERLVAEKANVVTIGSMDGRGYVFYPSERGTPHPEMDPQWLPNLTCRLRQEGIGILCWVCFNVQDVRDVADYVPAIRLPDWRMRYIEDPCKEYGQRVGMCLVSSPYIEWYARILREMAALDIDGFFFDGFYLGGIPHPARPGCTCPYCQEAFRADTGLDLPKVVDWTDPAFKRWVRWRNERLLRTARYFQAEIQQVNPDLTCTFNYNLWPFGRKDWETALPAWRIDDLGVSQHGYTSVPEEKWVMMGFKARIGRDINPRHTDMWRAGGLRHTFGGATLGSAEQDTEWHKLEMTTFILTGLAHGVTPWHSTIEGPASFTAAIHDTVERRERYFSREYVARVAVLYSQNAHDFYGHIPGTGNLADYRDGLLGTWMLLSEAHIPFEFVFDNQLDDRSLSSYRALILPNAACLSAAATAAIGHWTRNGGQLIATADTGAYDEWDEAQEVSYLREVLGMGGDEVQTVQPGGGRATYLPHDPGLAYCRQRDRQMSQPLLDALSEVEQPFEVQAPNWLVVNLFRAPQAGTYWVHLLNVSPFVPGGDSGFRGLDRPAAPTGTGAESVLGSPLVPAEGVLFKLNEATPISARLAVSDQALAIGDDGEVVIPSVGLHEVLILETRG